MREKTKKILNELRKAGEKGLTNTKLSQIALRYGSYLGDLYKNGYVIKKQRYENGIYNYVLIKEPEGKVSKKQKASEALLKEVSLRGSVTREELEELIKKVGVTIRYKMGTHQRSA